jgi:hypothetical protein
MKYTFRYNNIFLGNKVEFWTNFANIEPPVDSTLASSLPLIP